jgi:putative PIN family toxin of toxin-antitoxin system
VTKVVLDTNVLISAIVYGGNPRKVLEAVISGTVQMAVSEDLIKEMQAVLQRTQFGLSLQFIHNTVAELTSVAEWVAPEKHHELIPEDPSDNLVLDCAVAAQSDYLVSGDSHLLHLRKCGEVKIVTPQEFLEIQGRQ